MAGSEPPTQSPTVFSDKAATILATEHWSLLATRSMGWNEAFSRATMFLNVLSASVVALALVADATAFGDGFATFALVLFPLVLFLGLATYSRLVQVNLEEVYQVAAMNRLRHAYVEMAPELKPYFSAGVGDDLPSLFQTFSTGAPQLVTWLQFFVTTPTVVATIDSIIAAAGVALVAHRVGASPSTMIALSLAAFAVLWLALYSVQLGILRHARRTYVARFPAQ